MYEDLSFPYGSGTYAIYLRKSRKDLDAELWVRVRPFPGTWLS